jgi:hypothetical protein
MAKQDLGFRAPPSLAIAHGATTPDPGALGVVAWSTTTGGRVAWDGTAWRSIEPMRTYVVEFIRGVGVLRNGTVVQDTGEDGPFTYELPADVNELDEVKVVAGGTGGQGGGSIGSPLSLGGGGGGPSGQERTWPRVLTALGAELVVTVGAGGSGGAVNGNGGSGGGHSEVEGVLAGFNYNESGVLRANSAGMFFPAAGASASAVDVGGGGGTPDGEDGQSQFAVVANNQEGDRSQLFMTGSGHGGGGRASGAAGGSGGAMYGSFNGIETDGTQAAGTNPSGVSRGGGGQGGYTTMGRGGRGGSNAVGEDAPSYGAGGGGGAGGFAGGAGGDGYVRFAYRSAL